MELTKLRSTRSSSFVFTLVGLIVLLNILEISGFRSLKPKRVDNSEFIAWRGKSRIDFNDMVEIANWVHHLSSEAGRMTGAMRYYWVDNEVYYPYAAFVRGMYSVFNETYRDKKFPTTFLEGMEIIVHYCLLKSAFILTRRGGVRGNNQDAAILKAAVKPLQACYNTTGGSTSTNTTGKNFTADVFPIRRRKRMIRFPHAFRRRRNRSIALFKPQSSTKNARFSRNTTKAKNANMTVPAFFGRTIMRAPTEHPNPENLTMDEANNSVDSNMTRGPMQGRYMYKLNYGVNENVQKTFIDVEGEDDARMENIAVSIFWLIYEILPSACKWAPAQKQAYKTAFEGIVGLVVSLYLYDQDDFAEEYERIFRIPRKQYDSEWVKIEGIARQVQKDSKIDIRRPYSNTV